jgi:hypothetical protein
VGEAAQRELADLVGGLTSDDDDEEEEGGKQQVRRMYRGQGGECNLFGCGM